MMKGMVRLYRTSCESVIDSSFIPSEHVGVPLPMVQIRIVNQELYRNEKRWGQIFIKKPAIETKLTNNNASVSPYRNIEEIWIPTDDIGFWRQVSYLVSSE